MWTDPLDIAVAPLEDAEAAAVGKACWVPTSDPEQAAQHLFDRAMAKADRVAARLRRLGMRAHRRAAPYPFEIIQAPPGQVTIIHELNHQIRVVAMDKPMPTVKEQEVFPYYNGHSIGHFEGDTLVIHTGGFNEKTFIDATGAPHSDEMTTMERIRRISPTELEDVITIHDPEYYSRDWQARFVYKLRNDIRLEDYVCGEPHRDLSQVAGVRKP